MQIMTRRQERDIARKKMLKIVAIISTFCVAVVAGFLINWFVKSSQIDPQINFVIGECFYKIDHSEPWKPAQVGG